MDKPTDNPTPATVTELTAQLQAALAKIETLQTAKPLQALTIKRSEKGAVSVYGLGRFPLTLYISQWDRLLSSVPAIQAFIKANRNSLTTKG